MATRARIGIELKDGKTKITPLDGYWTSRQKNAIKNGYDLTDRLKRYTKEALGVSKGQFETKRHTIIWSGPGAGKTFTVNDECNKNRIKPIKFHGNTSMSAFAQLMAVHAYKNPKATKIVWVDDCDGFFIDSDSLNVMKGVLDQDRNILGWNVNMSTEIAKAEKAGNDVVAEAIRHFSTEGVGLEVPTDTFRFIITTNKKLASKQEALKSQKKMDEHAVRDRCNFRSFDITSEEAWGWMASNMLSTNVFAEHGFKLSDTDLHMILDTFYRHWDKLSANSMRTVMEAGAMLKNSPETFADEFEQNFLQ